MAGHPPLPAGEWVQGVIINGLFVYTRMSGDRIRWQVGAAGSTEVLAWGELPVRAATWEQQEAMLDRATARIARDYADPFAVREVAAAGERRKGGRR